MQQEQDDEVDLDFSKISARRIVFDNIDKQKHIYEVVNEQKDKDESSRLSTEFYEEYFRLINSIKKEQQQQN